MKTLAILKLSAAALCLACATVLPAAQAAEAFPARAVTLIVPYPPGGGADILARTVAKYLSEEWKQPVVVESKAGGGTTIAAAYVARAQPDGYTLLLSVTQHAIAPTLLKELSYDYLNDLQAVALLTDSPFILTTRPDSPIKDFSDLMKRLKENGPKMNFGSSGPASIPHLAGEVLNDEAGTKATHVPYAGTAPAMTALLGGQVDYLFADTSALPFIQGDKARAIAVSTRKRSPVLPDVPSVSEFLPDFGFSSWVGLEAPADTPAAIVESINAAVQTILKNPDLQENLAQTAKVPLFSTPEEYAQFKRDEVEKFERITTALGVKIE